MSVRTAVALLTLLATTACASQPPPSRGAFEERTEWIMGTTLRILLPEDRDDRDTLFASCFAAARQWDAWLSPWQADAALTRLSAGAGTWVELPGDVLTYLDRAVADAARTDGVFDITLAWQGSTRLRIDHERARAMLVAGARALDPGGDGKGVALDAMAAILDQAGVHAALLDFGGSSFVGRGGGSGGGGWELALTGPTGESLGVLTLEDSALSVSSSVQRDHGGDGTVAERFHLWDLRTGEPVRARRTAVVFSRSATEAEVLSTAAAVMGAMGLRAPSGQRVLERFPACELGLFEHGATEHFSRGRFDSYHQIP